MLYCRRRVDPSSAPRTWTSMLNLTKRVDYGLIALTHLALHPGERLSAREVASVYGLSQPLLANVFKELARLGFVRSVRGTKGGYELAEDPSSIPGGRLVGALEGPVRLAECIGTDGHDSGECGVSGACPVKRGVVRLHARIRDVLYGVTIGDLIRTSGHASSGGASSSAAASS